MKLQAVSTLVLDWTARLGGRALGAVEAVTSLPKEIGLALDTFSPTQETSEVRKRYGQLGIASQVAAGALAGGLLGGPLGLVCGATAGFLSGATSLRLQQRSGQLDQIIGQREQRYSSPRRLFLDLGRASAENFRRASTHSESFLRGCMAAGDNLRQGLRQRPELPGLQATGFKGALELASGLTCGLTGVVINAPGGAVLGMLHQAEGHSPEAAPNLTEKTLMLTATNLGKVLPASIVAGLVGGPAGVALGTAVGILTGSLTSIIDGRQGFHEEIVQDVYHSLAQGEASQDIYFRAGQGAVLGGVAGLRQGWFLGYRGGREIVRDLSLGSQA